MSDYRPISLCNVLYKIFSKVLANRLKKILPSIIIEHQSSFTKNRLISDNILVAFETLYSMNNHKSSKHGYMALKLDMSKTYDRVEWSFLEMAMRKLGFNERWITLYDELCQNCVLFSFGKWGAKRFVSTLKGNSTRRSLFYCVWKTFKILFQRWKVRVLFMALP